MKVLKFGGTSVGSVESIKNVKKIVEACDEPAIVVVSAVGGITDKLIETARLAGTGDTEYLTHFKGIICRHHNVIDGIVTEERKKEMLQIVNELLDELGNIFRGVSLIKDLSTKTQNTIVSYGDRISSVIVSRVINDAVPYDSREFIKTEFQF